MVLGSSQVAVTTPSLMFDRFLNIPFGLLSSFAGVLRGIQGKVDAKLIVVFTPN